MSWTPVERIDQALLGLEFAIKLMNFVELGKLDKHEFDTETKVLLPGGSLNFKQSAFHTDDDVVLGAQNIYTGSVATAAVAMEVACHGASLRNDPKDLSDRGQLRSIVYMVRCAFAHDLQTPIWKAEGPYARTFRLRFGQHDRAVNLKTLHAKPFDLDDIGGPLVFWDLLHEVRSWL